MFIEKDVQIVDAFIHYKPYQPLKVVFVHSLLVVSSFVQIIYNHVARIPKCFYSMVEMNLANT